MFKDSNEQKPSPFWKFLPIALVVFAILVAAALYFGQYQRVELEELTEVLHEGDAQYDWYRKYLELKNPNMQMGLNYAGNRIVMISGLIENGGERTIDVVEIKVTFFNYEEKIDEFVRAPIRPSPYTPPIPPLSERGFDFYVEKDIPEGWGGSHSEMEIHGFRFAE